MAECPGGRTNRGTRSQFRLGTPSLGLFKGLYPIHMGDIMDVGQSSQTGISSVRDLVSPGKVTRTRTVREYEQTIDELKKENFDLKVRVYLCEEAMNKVSRKDKDDCSPDKDTVQVVVQLKLETESLRKELSYKEKLLQDALERAEKYELNFKELEKQYIDLQNELESLSELPSKQEFLLLLDEKENLVKENESLEQALIEKNEEIHDINQKIEILANQNTLLEEKIKKRSLAIQGFVYKNHKEKEMFPDELRKVVISATQAAKNRNKEDLVIAVKSFDTALNKMMSSSVQIALKESEEKENIGTPQAKCLKEEFLEKSSAFLPSQTKPCTELSRIQSLKEVLAERNTPETNQFHSLDSVVHDSFVKGAIVKESSVNVPEKSVIDCLNFSPFPLSSTQEENLISFSNRQSSQLGSIRDNNLISIETVASSVVSSNLMQEETGLTKRDSASLLGSNAEESYQTINVLKENEKLKLELKEKLTVIQDLRTAYKELEMKGISLQEVENDALKASQCYNVYAQTDITGSNLLDVYEMTKLQKDAKLSSNVDELREDVLLLLLAIEDKNKELSNIKQTLSAVQEDLNRALNTTNILDKDYMNERNELHERLASSCAVNEKLMKHLRSLETFMEDLLQNKFDSSMESSERSNILSTVSRCLNESLMLSHALSDHLSFCEGSKLFEECESVLYKNASCSDDKSLSLPHLNLSELNMLDQRSSSYPGTHNLEDYIPFVRKSDQRMSKELDDSQLCWRCWQQLSSPVNNPEISHLMQNVASKHITYPSSDSDIWSEPDRNVSMQRIGISLQNSPVASKSPRKLRLKEKRISNKLTSDQNTSSSEMYRWSKQRRHGSVTRRLFAQDSIKNQDFTSEKFYFFIAEKYSKLKTLLEEVENIKDGGVSDEIWIKMNAVLASLGEALQKLHIARENAKNFPSTMCGKCVMLELFMDLEASHKEVDFCIDDSSSQNEILQQFQNEVRLLKEACKEFSIFRDIVDKRSQSTQSDSLSENEQVKISELEDAIVDLNDKNRKLNTYLEEVKGLLSKEKEMLKSVKSENLELCTQINQFKKELFDLKQKEKYLSLKNEELVEKLSNVDKSNSELNSALKDLEEKKIQSDSLSENEQVKISELEEVKGLLSKEKEMFKSVKSENLELSTQISDLKNELLEMKQKEKDLSLKNIELFVKLANVNKNNSELNSALKDLEEKRTQPDSLSENEQIKISELEDAIVDLNDKNGNLNKNLEEVKGLLSKEKEILKSVKSENQDLCTQINRLKNELLNIKQKEKDLSLKNEELSTFKENDSALNSALKVLKEKRTQCDSLSENEQVKVSEFEDTIADLNDKNRNLNKNLEGVKELLSKEKEMLKSVKSENLELCTQVKDLKNELLDLKQKEKYLSLKNEKLDEKLSTFVENDSELNSALKVLKEKRTQCDSLSENEQVMVSEFEDSIADLNDKNRNLNKNLEGVKELLSKEKEMLRSVKSENLELCTQVKDLKNELLDLKQKEKYLSLKNQELDEKLSTFVENDSELNSALKVLKEKRTQCDSLSENEQVKISELEESIVVLNDKNRNLNKNLEEVKELLSKEKEISKSVKSENQQLCTQINDLKGELLDMKQKEKDLFVRIEKLVDELANVDKNNSELKSALKDLEEKKMQSDSLSENEQVKISELEESIVVLNDKNRNLNKNLEEVRRLLSKEKEMLKSVKSENQKLFTQINDLKCELLDMKQKEKDLSVRNEKLVEELANVDKNNSELNSALKNLEEKRKESSIALDQLTTELQKNKLDLVNMNLKCLKFEKELNEQIQIKEQCEEKLKTLEFTSLSEKESYLNQIDNLKAEKRYFLDELESVQLKKRTLESENIVLGDDLKSKCSELICLQETVQVLEGAKETLILNNSQLQTELKNAKDNLLCLQKKCSVYEEEVLLKFKANEEEYCRQLKQLETDSLGEKKKLLCEISQLSSERENILKNLNTEKERYERLISEKDELNQNFAESCQQISSLKLLNEELKCKQVNLLQRNEFFENALLSSNSECKILSKDLKCMRETLQNLESKCVVYEKELIATAGMKDSLVECLLNIISEFSTHRQKLNDMCKVYSNEYSVVCDEISISEFIPVIDENNVKKLSENLCFESKKLLQSVDILLELLKGFHLKSLETKNAEEKFNFKTTSLRKQMEFHKVEVEHVKSQNDHLQQVIAELQKSISMKEKSIQYSAYEIQSLKEKMHNTKEEIEKSNQLLKRKDDEITMLQERVFNLQTDINSIMADRVNFKDKTHSRTERSADDEADFVSSDSPLPPKNLKEAAVTSQTSKYNPYQSADESLVSASSFEGGKNSCCEKYLKKYHSLQAFCKKQIETLKKEKNDLREHYLNQLQCMKDSHSEEKEESVSVKLIDLETKLEQKKAFISELKAELLKTCNSLIDKQKEVDDLKEKLSQYEVKSKCTVLDKSDHSISTPKTVDSNIRSLRNYKWKLIQTIFDIQRRFYEKRGIHLNYIDRFKDHVNNLHSMQLSHSLSKSESMPLLGSHCLKPYDQGDDKLKNLVGLELDIECLENLKIFLNRFFAPCVLQTSQTLNETSSNIETEENKISRKQSLETEVEKFKISELERMSFLGISFPNCFTDHLTPDHKEASEKTVSFENFASNVSHHLDYIKDFFIGVRKCQWLESLDLSARESVEKAEIKSLLLKICEEIKILQDGADKLFNLNTNLKAFDFIVAPPVPLSFSRPDVSDRESLMSEETIAISRGESPLSFEDLCPVKLPCPEMLNLKEQTMKPKSLRSEAIVTEPYSGKVTAIGSSCDSVCQRSHYSSPDLGIESDPNHESSAPEHKEEGINKYQRLIMEERKFVIKPQQKTAFTNTESAGRFKGMKFGDTLYSIGNLPHYELLKREIQESLVGIKSVLSRTGDGLHHIAKYTSPRKTLEYSTLKAIKDTCANIEVCLKKAYTLVGKFWISACPTESEWKALLEENKSMSEQLANFKAMIQKQETEFKKAMGKLEQAQLCKASMEKKISKKLVKTKNVIRQAERKLLEKECQNYPPVPKYPSEQTEQFLQASLVQQRRNV